MAAPATCVITSPTGSQNISALPTGVATFTITGTTDATTPISVALTPSAGGSPLTTTSNGAGAWSVTATAVPVHAYSVTATAGTAPDTLDSSPVAFNVIAASLPSAAFTTTQDATWYANWLAGKVTALGTTPPMTFDDAICTYRGVAVTTGVIKALNNWASITDPQQFLPVVAVLNRIAATNSVAGAGGLGMSEALKGICKALFP